MICMTELILQDGRRRSCIIEDMFSELDPYYRDAAQLEQRQVGM